VGDSRSDEIFRSTLPRLEESRYRQLQGIYNGRQQGLDSRLVLLISRAPLACCEGPAPVPRLTHIHPSEPPEARLCQCKWVLRNVPYGFALRYVDSSENHLYSTSRRFRPLEIAQGEVEGGRVAPVMHLPRFRRGFSYLMGCMTAQAREPPQGRVTVKILSRECQ
jgi:hypothetical protein